MLCNASYKQAFIIDLCYIEYFILNKALTQAIRFQFNA